MKVFKLALWALSTLILLAVFAALAGQNQDLMQVSLFNWTSGEHSKWSVLLVAFFSGALLASIFFIVQLIIVETKNIRLRRINQKLERALASQKTTEAAVTQTKGSAPASNLPGTSNFSSGASSAETGIGLDLK